MHHHIAHTIKNTLTYNRVWCEVEMLKQNSNNQVDNPNHNSQWLRPEKFKEKNIKINSAELDTERKKKD